MSQSAARDKLDAFGIDEICALTADCVPQRKIATQIGISWSTMMIWIDADKSRSEQYARAREAMADKFAEDMLNIADDSRNDTQIDDDGNRIVDHDNIARSRLRVDARKWLASKMAPKKYGDRQQVDLNDITPLTQDQVDKKLAAFLSKVGSNSQKDGENE